MAATRKKLARKVFNLDGLYSPAETATWMGVSKRTLLELARSGKIPTVRLNERLIRFNPRTILAKAT
jgi:excisionase family DNA binding protein